MIVLIALVLTLILLPLTLWFYHYFNTERYLKNIPGPIPLPIAGNILQVGDADNALERFVSMHKKYGSIYKIRTMFATPDVVIADPKLAEEVLKSYELLHKSASYDFFHNWLGTGLLTSADQKWKRHRRMLTPSFHFKILEGFIDSFNKYGNILVRRLESEVGKQFFDVYSYITLYTLDIICASSMGTNVNAQEQSDSEYVKDVKEICRIICERSTSVMKAINFLYTFTSDYKAENRVLKKLHEFTGKIIATRREELESIDTTTDNDVSEVGIKRRLTFLDSMLQFKEEGKGISDEEIREEVDTFMFEGHDTTASAISFILYCLANNQPVQEILVEEINSILADSSDTNYQDLQEMKYLEMVVKEALRLYPSAPMVARKLIRDAEIGGYTFPKGTNITIDIFALHRDPTFFPDPETFSPERFTPENQSKRPVHSYIPFSAGPRNCIGQKFAMLEMKACVVKILKNFCVLPAIPEHKPKLGGLVVLKSFNGVHIKLEKRK